MNREIQREQLFIELAENNKEIAKLNNEIVNRKIKIMDIEDELLMQNIEEEIKEETTEKYSFVPDEYEIIQTPLGANVELSNGIKISASYAKPYKNKIVFINGTANKGGILRGEGRGKNVGLLASELLKIRNSLDFIPKIGEKAKQDFLKHSLGIDKKVMLDIYLFHIDFKEYDEALADYINELNQDIPQSEIITKVKQY